MVGGNILSFLTRSKSIRCSGRGLGKETERRGGPEIYVVLPPPFQYSVLDVRREREREREKTKGKDEGKGRRERAKGEGKGRRGALSVITLDRIDRIL